MSQRVREIRLAAFSRRPYKAEEWRDALVIVQRGVLELETVNGVRRRFGLGSVLFLEGLRLRTLRNPERSTTVLSSTSR